jgi:hypothetical protein
MAGHNQRRDRTALKATYPAQANVTEKRLFRSVKARFGVKPEAAKSAFSAAGVNL